MIYHNKLELFISICKPIQHESLNKFARLNKDWWIGMFNAKCIFKPSILTTTVPIDAISKALVFVKLKYMSLLYNLINP